MSASRALRAVGPSEPALNEDLAAEVRAGLGRSGQKKIPSRFFYDDLGSALFEVISFLPEYGLTRADERILREHAAEMVRRFAPPLVVAELGSGSGRKTRCILEALAGHQRTTYFPIDISPAALAQCALELGQLRDVGIEPIEARYLDGLKEVAGRRGRSERLLVLFLGSTIGNFERSEAQEFLRQVRQGLRPGDGLLLGTDLLKPVPDLLAAYDDALGVTAAFNLNLLLRINRELDADFDLSLFEHEARWNEAEHRVESHLVARRGHTVAIHALGMRVKFLAGEGIWTESAYKFGLEEPGRIAREAGFHCAAQWVDPEWPFAESLLLAR